MKAECKQLELEEFIMEYIYRMSKRAYMETVKDAMVQGMTVEQYVTKTFGLLGKCIKVEIA